MYHVYFICSLKLQPLPLGNMKKSKSLPITFLVIEEALFCHFG